MNLQQFKLVKNKQRPTFCYSYELKEAKRKFSIFTMNSGNTFLASIEEPRKDGRWYTEFSETFSNENECIEAISNHLTK